VIEEQIPEMGTHLRTDNSGKFINVEYKLIARKRYHFSTSVPTILESNGHAERTNRTHYRSARKMQETRIWVKTWGEALLTTSTYATVVLQHTSGNITPYKSLWNMRLH